jgi:hypothetical protein
VCLDDEPKSFAILWNYFLPRSISVAIAELIPEVGKTGNKKGAVVAATLLFHTFG